MPLEIPEVVISRLPVYYRQLSRIKREGRTVVSSQELGDALSVTPAQIRKDLSYFGRFGKQGRGYSVQRLIEELRKILGLERRWNMVVVGIGRLGRAIVSYDGFAPHGFEITALYDSDPATIGTDVNEMTVRDSQELERDLLSSPPEIGVVAVPAEHAQEVIDTLVRCGVRAILSYAPRAVQVPPHVRLEQIDPVISLQSITYHLTHDSESQQSPIRGPGGAS
jgi:redox-sensing transcriptional repressor